MDEEDYKLEDWIFELCDAGATCIMGTGIVGLCELILSL